MLEAQLMCQTPLMPLPREGHVFNTAWPLRASDIEPGWRLRIDGVARYLQDAGFDHLDAVSAREEHPAWVVRRTVIDSIKPIEFPGNVEVHRWCSGLSSRWCTMRARLSTANGGLIETEGFWININPNTGLPTRITEQFEALLGETALSNRVRWKQWITASPGPEDESAPFPLRSTDIDVMAHVNNAVYLHAVDAALRARPELHDTATRTVIEYLAPVAPDEKVELRTRHSSDDVHLWFVVDGNVRAQAAVLPLP
ncbi:thioesterase [Hoyosella sp. YIM 151337]|uniref:acyl-[acyl-carrier-protein] thioesterase n=1 Tax=Hoyosella sp. YIM 151337 TaxID=2992742 RepID=UPI0022362D00|nr:acyl-ACP thioesterase domain-containing protein [Hoyosella sp. YIM 151337]MCW4351931.1 thioesterase [Hoyosella sp. YIM 151337]